MINILSVDVEDYFHPSEVVPYLGGRDWDTLPSRVEAATNRILDRMAAHQVKGTFFILGWVAHRHPKLVAGIAARGHEIACHSYAHRLVYDLTPDQFREDTKQAVAVIEDACGVRPRAYRAPSYSITERSMWALEILVECGFTRDSSIYPIHHDRYGIPGFPSSAHAISTPSGPVFEVPIATAHLSADRAVPVGGGGYMRLLPYRYTAAGIRWINERQNQPACLYLHPWEMDPDQPKLVTGRIARWRTYTGLRSMAGKLERLLRDFEFTRLDEVYPE